MTQCSTNNHIKVQTDHLIQILFNGLSYYFPLSPSTSNHWFVLYAVYPPHWR